MCGFAGQRVLLDEMITDNSELLRRYLGEKSEAAFAELVQRNIDLVYSCFTLGPAEDLAVFAGGLSAFVISNVWLQLHLQ